MTSSHQTFTPTSYTTTTVFQTSPSPLNSSYLAATARRTFARPSKSYAHAPRWRAVLSIQGLISGEEKSVSVEIRHSSNPYITHEIHTVCLGNSCRGFKELDLVRKQRGLFGEPGEVSAQSKPQWHAPLHGEMEMGQQCCNATHLLVDALGVGKHGLFFPKSCSQQRPLKGRYVKGNSPVGTLARRIPCPAWSSWRSCAARETGPDRPCTSGIPAESPSGPSGRAGSADSAVEGTGCTGCTRAGRPERAGSVPFDRRGSPGRRSSACRETRRRQYGPGGRLGGNSPRGGACRTGAFVRTVTGLCVSWLCEGAYI